MSPLIRIITYTLLNGRVIDCKNLIAMETISWLLVHNRLLRTRGWSKLIVMVIYGLAIVEIIVLLNSPTMERLFPSMISVTYQGILNLILMVTFTWWTMMEKKIEKYDSNFNKLLDYAAPGWPIMYLIVMEIFTSQKKAETKCPSGRKMDRHVGFRPLEMVNSNMRWEFSLTDWMLTLVTILMRIFKIQSQ